MKKSLLKIIALLLLIILPITVRAEEKYEITAVSDNQSEVSYTYSSYEYREIMGTTDKYIYIKGNGATYRLNKETLKEDIDIKDYNNYNLSMADGTLYNIKTREDNGTYYLDFTTYDQNVENPKTISIDSGIKDTSISVGKKAYANGYYYVNYYTGSYWSNRTDYLIIFDKNGNVKKNIEVTEIESLNLLSVNNTIFAISSEYNSGGYDSYIYSISSDGEITLKLEIKNISINTISYTDSEYIALGNSYNNSSNEGPRVIAFDENFKETKNKLIKDIATDAYYLNYRIVKKGNEYIVFDKNQKKLNVLNNDLELLYQVDCRQNFLETVDYYGPYIDGDDIYIIGGYGIQDYSNEPAGNFIIKLEKPSVDYTITTKVLEGEGQVSSSKQKSASNELIEYTVTPAEGYKVKTINVIKEDNTKIEVNNNTFTMPEANVIIEVIFIKDTDTPKEEKEEDKEDKEEEKENPETYTGIPIIICLLTALSFISFLRFKQKYEWEK